MARIKICGIRRVEDVQYVNRTQPDYAGFILSSGFKRSINFETASILVRSLHKSIERVGVFVNEQIEIVNSCVNELGLDYVQLHGDESIDYCKGINAKIIKVFKPKDFDKVFDYEPFIDYYLFDSGTGTGKSFDWSNIPNVKKPFFLAGGLDSTNLKMALKEVNPYAVDMSSSVEVDGYKDYDKIKEVIDIVRDYNE